MPYVERNFWFRFVFLLVEACAGDVTIATRPFEYPAVIAFRNRWCRASRTKGGAENTPFDLLCLLVGDLAIQSRSAAVSFLTRSSFLLPACCFYLHFFMV